MRFSDIGKKEIVNLSDGSRLGIVAESDLLVNERTGKIIALLIPAQKSFLQFFSTTDTIMEIPWEAVKKIGNDMIIIESEADNKEKYSYDKKIKQF